MAANDLWRLSAAETARKIRDGDFTAEDAVASAIGRMNAVNPGLNAVVEDLSAEALERARDLDRARGNGAEPGPLHGVPVTIKVNVDQKGHATTNGIPALKDFIAPANAPVVDNLLKAGAVVIGRTNTPEFSFRADTDNPLYGRTRNPWGDHVSPGGSSGGAGAAVMAGIGALAHGNDIGGSLRFPAAANGAVTVKPGLGRVPAWNPGQKAERGMLAQSMSVQGLIARTAGDLALSMPSLIAPDPRDPFHVPLPFAGPPRPVPIKVAFTKQCFGFDLHPEVAAALDTAADALSDSGYIVEEIDPPLAREAGEDGYRALMGEVVALMKPDIDALGSDTIKAIFAEYFDQFPPYTGTELLQNMARRSHYARAWSLFLEDYPLVLTPFLPQPFFRPDRDTEGAEGVREALGAAIWSYSMNFLGLPAGNLPTRLATLPQGPQPINVQIIGMRWREDLIVQAMRSIETRIGGLYGALWDRMG
ncbi:amidase family protein [Marinibacterium profundimaris]|uniref:Amidase n=1 Tax=Marinibacterium profundimaris TaxID=1679460 RepID=A0A225NEF4_9RHOB|nr:amidase family protein [Marinibacterium profundimaris]OWU70435.1 amidase [Marinibacterium profundimaris]